MARKTSKTKTAARTNSAAPEAGQQGGASLKKPDLLDQIVARTNLKKRDVKPAIEAALVLMGDALREGTELNLPPLGKLRVVKSKDLDGGASVVTLKLRTPKNASVAVQEASEE
jgi:nucleoid DNA-binding protein